VSESSNKNCGVLLVNLGSPTAPTSKAVKEFLLPFLSDPRVVDSPRWFWIPLLRGVIIPFRSPRVSKAYASVWYENGSPLTVISKKQTAALQSSLDLEFDGNLPVELAMTYNQPSVESGIKALTDKGVEKIIVLPLYPQYSSSTTAAVFDAVAKACKKWKNVPDFRFVRQYFNHPQYIQALANTVRQQHGEQSSEHAKDDYLIFSFHGIPKRFCTEGDPYQIQCQQTAKLVAQELSLTEDQWQIAYQSRVGREEWLKPYFDQELETLPNKGVKNVSVISPAFAADCLETLEEIDMENRELFMESGGENYQYIPALNDNDDHIELMKTLVKEQLVGWNN
jgi:ferrochelatase